MALITLTPDQSVNALYPASILIDEADLFRATSFADALYPLANATVVFSAPSAFLGDQQSIVVKETVAAIDALSSVMFAVTVGSSSVLLNANNIIDVVSDGLTGSKILYKEFGIVTTIFTTQSPAVVNNNVNFALNSSKMATLGASYSGNSAVPVAAILSGIITCSAAATLTLDTVANFQAAGMKYGSYMEFFVTNSSVGVVTIAANGGVVSTANAAGFGGNAMQVQSGDTAKFSVFSQLAANNSYLISRIS